MKRLVILFLMAFLIGISVGAYIKLNAPDTRQLRIDPDVQIDPEKEYHLTVWECIPTGKKDLQSGIEEALARLSSLHPNIKVDIKFFNINNGAEILKRALEEGTPPDIFCGPCLEVPNYTFQIPLGIFLDEGELSAYQKSSIEGGTWDGLTWVLPRWFSPTFLIGNSKVLTDAGVDLKRIFSNGWTWEEFSEALALLERHNQKVLFATYELWLLDVLLANNGLRAMVSPEGDFLWNEAKVIETARFLKDIQQMKAFYKDSQLFYGRGLDYLLQGKIAIYGKGNLPMLITLQERTQDINKGILKSNYPRPTYDLIPLPIPHNSQNELCVNAEFFYISVFRSKKNLGDDHLKAAVEVAKFLTRDGSAVYGVRGGLLPAYKQDQKTAIDSMALSPLTREALYIISSHSAAPITYSENFQELIEQFQREVILPLSQELLQDNLTPETFGHKVISKGEITFTKEKKSSTLKKQFLKIRNPFN